MKKHLLKSILIIGWILLITSSLSAQRLIDMTCSIFDGSWEPISGTQILGASDDGTVNVNWSGLGFDFKYNDVQTTNALLSANGFILFNTTSYYSIGPTYIYQNNPGASIISRDGYVRQNIVYEIQGTAPNRTMIFQWNNYDIYYGNNTGTFSDFQVRLHETSNMLEIIFGDVNSGSYAWGSEYNGVLLGFSTTNSNEWINIESGDGAENFVAHFSNINPLPRNASKYIMSAESFYYLHPGLTIQLTAYPTMTGVYPSEGSVFRRGAVYTNDRHPAAYFERIDGQANVAFRYKISGPMPETNPEYKVIYTGTNEGDLNNELIVPNPQPVGSPATTYITHAKGLAARQSPNDGAFDLLTNQTQIPGGQYKVEAEMVLVEEEFTQPLGDQFFTIALDNDLALTSLSSPKPKDTKKYPFSASVVPVIARITNIGVNDVTEFSTTARIFQGTTQIWESTKTWTSDPSPLRTSDYKVIEYGNFVPPDIGDYSIVIECSLLNANDNDLTNNRFPKAGLEYYFTVAHEIEAEAIDILVPSGNIYVNKPIRPIAKFQNNGVSDISDIPATMKIKRVGSDQYVYIATTTIQDIPQGVRLNTSEVMFNDVFTPPYAGEYEACVYCTASEDVVRFNDTVCTRFNVVEAMNGTYTIGLLNQGRLRNYETFEAALNDLYLVGVTGPVTFELTDAEYNIGSEISSQTYPALDFSAKIIGVSPNNTITFKPSLQKSLSKASIRLNMYSGIGIGMLFGQNYLPSNQNAAVLGVSASLVKQYANSLGYINFDGGQYKSIKLDLQSGIAFKAPVYLAQGASNISIKNCVIEGDLLDQQYSDIPLTRYDPSQSLFFFQKDMTNEGETYTAGIVMRSKAPTDKGSDNSNSNRLDTLFNQNNVIEGNEIYNFGYGIVDFGIGPLYNEGHAQYERYYNKNNTIKGNVIHDITRAGIFIGFEENSTIENNKIFSVNGNYNNEAHGILVGGEGNSDYLGYNNIGINIRGNEISGISSNSNSYGIKVEQSQNAYPYNDPPFVYYPDVDESMKISNNIIWGLTTTTDQGSRAGLRLFTSRALTGSEFDRDLTPKSMDYFSRNDKICNNTIILNSDNMSEMSAGLSIQQVTGAIFTNNAIAVYPNTRNNDAISTALILESQLPKTGAITADRNVYWYPEHSNTSLYIFVETDENNNILQIPDHDEFTTLEQWQAWTGQDMNSAYGNFTNDLAYTGTAPNQKLRVKSNPVPIGSLLNNRGNTIDWITKDIDGKIRGSAGQRYDIGAIEFDGRVYVADVEVSSINKPQSYQASSGAFSDAQYIMTDLPFTLNARVRNNGNVLMAKYGVNLKIYRENPDGTYPEQPEFQQRVETEVEPSETVDVLFSLRNLSGGYFSPLTYYDLRNEENPYTVPERFSTMWLNVTPLYKVVIETESDLNNANNVLEKYVRFYIKRSELSMILSAENSTSNITETSPTETIAGKLNLDSAMSALTGLGWNNVLSEDNTQTRFLVDLFDRASWEPKAVNYPIYRTMVWSDADGEISGSAITRQQRLDMRRFLSESSDELKKNLVVGSQELIRQCPDLNFTKEIFRAHSITPGNPLGNRVSNNGKYVLGEALNYNMLEKISATGFTNDADPYCALIDIDSEGDGLASVGFRYVNHEANPDYDIMSVVSTTLARNVVFLGVDWRHWSNPENAMRGAFDFIIKNDGVVIPVELVDFDAVAIGNRVDISWITASENNTSKFEVEKALRSTSGTTQFEKINELDAAGMSSVVRKYGPVVDNSVTSGNKYVYRLKVVDVDGSYSYSNEKEVLIGGDNSAWLGLPQPNPSTTKVKFDFNAGDNDEVNVFLYDVNGKAIAPNYTISENSIMFDITRLSSGTYTVSIQVGNTTLTRQFNTTK